MPNRQHGGARAGAGRLRQRFTLDHTTAAALRELARHQGESARGVLYELVQRAYFDTFGRSFAQAEVERESR